MFSWWEGTPVLTKQWLEKIDRAIEKGIERLTDQSGGIMSQLMEGRGKLGRKREAEWDAVNVLQIIKFEWEK